MKFKNHSLEENKLYTIPIRDSNLLQFTPILTCAGLNLEQHDHPH